jgi:predicted nucleic acid-binding protein
LIVLDTNVISELMRAVPDPLVLGWVASQPRSDLFTTRINHAEILAGIAAMPAGKRRTDLGELADAIFEIDFVGHILPFGRAATARYADIVVPRRAAGRAIDGNDALIAAIALGAGAAVATRDIGGFDACGLELINPWIAG